ncbi:MAG: hypothetical protein JSV33_09000 [bacterium]|nr:MAG: hypothetical protein JSV33_09000 [bacterium]
MSFLFERFKIRTDMSQRRLSAIDLLIVAVGVIVLGVHVFTYYPFYSDDALISMRYAQRLLDGRGLTWTDGPPVEGYSNLLWILGAAVFGLFGMDLINATRLLGALCGIAVFAALLYRRMTGGTNSTVPLAAGTVVCATCAPIAAWTLAGLEAPLVAALLIWGLIVLLKANESPDRKSINFANAGLFFGLLCLTRLDGPLFAAVAAAWVAAVGRKNSSGFRNAVSFLIWPVVFISAQQVFRLSYYGEWLPNVYYVKVSPSIKHLATGFAYVRRGFVSLMPVSALAVLGLILMIIRNASRRWIALLLLTSTIAWLAYVSFIGGDIFKGWRHMIPFVALMTVAIVLLFEWLSEAGRLRWKGWLPVAIVAVAWFVIGQFRDDSNQYVKKDLWVWNAQVVGQTLRAAFYDVQPVLAICAAGGIPYWSELSCIDMLGLSDHRIARAESPEFGQHWIGHGRADASYVLMRRPDLIHFGTAGGGEPRTLYKEQIDGIDAFWRDYELCNIAGQDPFGFTTRIYVRRESTRIGIITTSEKIYVPPYFLSGGVAVWHERLARFVVALLPKQAIRAHQITIGPGRWGIILPRGQTDVLFIDRETKKVTRPEFIDNTPTLTLDEEATFDVIIGSRSDQPVPVFGLELQRR